MGLTEVESMQGLEEIVKKLNEFKKTKKFKHITSKRLKGSYAGYNQAEYTSIIYNSAKLEVKDFTNGKKGFSYQEKFKSKWSPRSTTHNFNVVALEYASIRDCYLNSIW